MQPVTKIPKLDWMEWPETTAIFDALNNSQDEPCALFVGGCVRNAVLELPSHDIDIATKHTPDDVIKLLKAKKIKSIPTGIDHGTVTAVIGERSFEITTLRKDVETDGRHAVVAFSENWVEDASRRDFTMNTLLMDADGNVFDPTQQGMYDLLHGRVLFVGKPKTRIAEDYLRILRFFRFHALYGRDKPNQNALDACRQSADKISTLSKERISQEFFKIVTAEHAHDTLSLMKEHDVLQTVMKPDTEITDHLYNLGELQIEAELDQDNWYLMARMVILSNFDKSILDSYSKTLLFSKDQQKAFQSICQALETLSEHTDYKLLRKSMYLHGREATLQAALIEFAKTTPIFTRDQTEQEQYIRIWKIPECPFTGDDLKQQGFSEGPDLGKKLKELETGWIERDFKSA